MGPGERGEDHAWDRAGQASHGGLFCWCCAKGFAGAQEERWFTVARLGMGRMNPEPPLRCGGEVQHGSVSMAGGRGRDHGVLG